MSMAKKKIYFDYNRARDQFAGRIIMGMCCGIDEFGSKEKMEQMAKQAFDMADLMMLEKQERHVLNLKEPDLDKMTQSLVDTSFGPETPDEVEKDKQLRKDVAFGIKMGLDRAWQAWGLPYKQHVVELKMELRKYTPAGEPLPKGADL